MIFPYRGLLATVIIALGILTIILGVDRVPAPRASLIDEVYQNSMNTAYPSVSVSQLHSLLESDTELTLLDVRTAEELQEQVIDDPRLIHIPLDEVLGRVSELPQEKPVYVICRSGNRSEAAQMLLAPRGVDVINVEGGMNAWASHGYHIKGE